VLALASLGLVLGLAGCTQAESGGGATPSVVTPVTAVMPTDAIGQWLFTNGTSDTSGNNYGASRYGTTPPAQTADRHNTANVAYSFDGTLGSIEVGGLADTSDLQLAGTSFSISVWVKSGVISSFPDNEGIISKYQTSGSKGYFIRVKSSGKINIGAARDYTTTSPVLSDLNWHHLVWTYDKATTTNHLYVDNALVKLTVGTTDSTDAVFDPGIVANTDALCFGADFASRYWTGSLDDIRIFKRVLTAGEVLGLYQE